MSKTSLSGSEKFYTLQGEGPNAGKPALFIRLTHCDLGCSWCDTPYTWRADVKEKPTDFEPSELLQWAWAYQAEYKVNHVVITGGEPLLQQKREGWELLLVGLKKLGFHIEIETAGHHIPNDVTLKYVDQYNISPKLAHSGNGPERQLQIDFWKKLLTEGHSYGEDLGERVSASWRQVIVNLKFVVGSTNQELVQIFSTAREKLEHQINADLAEIRAIISNWPASNVYLMPEGVTIEEQLHKAEAVAEACKGEGYNLCLRQHTLVWGTKRGT